MKFSLLTTPKIPLTIPLNDNGNQNRIRVDIMYVCLCKGIKEADVQELGRAGVTCPKILASTLGIDDKDNCCGRCLSNISDFVAIASKHCTQQCPSPMQA